MEDKYRLVSRICPETGTKQWGIQRDTFSPLSLFTKKLKGKMCYLYRDIEEGSRRTHVVMSRSKPSSRVWALWYHRREEVEAAMKRYFEVKRRQAEAERINKAIRKASKDYGVQIERNF